MKKTRGFEKIKTDRNVQIPERKTSHSAGYDFFCAEDVIVKSRSMAVVTTGVRAIIPPDEFLLVAIRSSLALKKSIALADGVAIIDADYNEEIFLPVYNFGTEDYLIHAGDRVAQGIFLKYETLGEVVDKKRVGGFGSTGE